MRVTVKVIARFFGCAALCFCALVAHAVEVNSTTNTTNSGSAAWNYVGTLNGASGVFLGNYGGSGWVLTAAHVGAGSFTLGGTTYSSTGTTFSNFFHNGLQADLTLFQISGTPNLTNLSLAHPASGSAVQMIGFGSGVESWGNNTIYGYTNYTLSGPPYGGPGVVTLASGGGQGAGGDSGGGLFYELGGSWYLTGILSGTGNLTDNNSNNLGAGTISVDLVVYASQITADLNSVGAIPEPATCAVISGLGALLGVVVQRRRSKGR
jgi:hypothetical protein